MLDKHRSWRLDSSLGRFSFVVVVVVVVVVVAIAVLNSAVAAALLPPAIAVRDSAGCILAEHCPTAASASTVEQENASHPRNSQHNPSFSQKPRLDMPRNKQGKLSGALLSILLGQSEFPVSRNTIPIFF